jgi:predicted DNA-binding protein YlxM (UPF0122 family)
LHTIVNKFKELTGFNYSDIAAHFNVSRQFIHQQVKSTSQTHIQSLKYMLIEMIDLKIVSLQTHISKLIDLKSEIKQKVS